MTTADAYGGWKFVTNIQAGGGLGPADRHPQALRHGPAKRLALEATACPRATPTGA
ncbi:MAG: hypothetical protein R2755_13335 [Acidimicrobiales bacterium]